MSSGRSLEVAALTHRGGVRSQNEDAIAIDQQLLIGNMIQPWAGHLPYEGHVFLVADGMGGHTHGALASRIAVETLTKTPHALFDTDSCAEALSGANNTIYDVMRQVPGTIGMGTTVVGVALTSQVLIHFNVGDSRVYRHNGNELIRLSHDDVPLISGMPPYRRESHQITQSLGGQSVQRRIAPHIGVVPPLSIGEVVLLCSDGLTDMITDDDISTLINQSGCLAFHASELFSRAMRAGGSDNISIILIRLQ